MTICLITGCSSGFGEALAIAFAQRGDTVIATMRQPDKAPAALRDHANIEIVALDVTDAAARASTVTAVVARHGRLDLLVNNAGISAMASFEDTPENLSRRIFDTNYFAPVELMRLVLPIMRAQGGGRIVNVTAIGAVLSTPLLGVYCASKHALDAASAGVDIEGRPFGVRAPSVLPGQFKTSIADNMSVTISPAYAGIDAALKANRTLRAGDVQTDLSEMVDAVIAAATDAEPKARYLAGLGIALELKTSLAELERLQKFDAGRAGLS